MSEEVLLWEGKAEKYSIGRSTGLQMRNWQKRFFRITNKKITYSVKEGDEPKGTITVKSISGLYTAPTKDHHDQAKAGMLAIKYFDGDTYTLLLKPDSDEKDKCVEALKKAVENVKGVDIV